MDTIAVKPKQSVNLMLENVSSLRNPKLSIMLADGNNTARENRTQTLLYNVNTAAGGSINLECSSCESLKNMLYLRDRTIMKLAEDRDQIKIKLTKAMNMNIELSRQLMRYQNNSPTNRSTNHNNLSNRSSPSKLNSGNFYNEKIREEVNDLRTKCKELEEINHHLKHHLNTLRNVFVELGNEDDTQSSADTTNICSEPNSSSVAITTTVKTNETIYANLGNAITTNDKNNNSFQQQTDDDLNNLKKGTQIRQSESQQQLNSSNKKASTPEPVPEEEDDEEVVEEATTKSTKPSLSNFEIWYNS